MNNKIFGTVLVVLVGVTAGIFLLLSVTNVMQQTMMPLGKELQSVNTNLRAIQAQLTNKSGTDVNDQLLARLSVIERRLESIEQKPSNNTPPAPPMPPQEDYGKVYNIDISHSYVHGKKDAPVTIIAFTDFQCPFCSRFHGPVKEVLKAYPDKVNYVVKNFPLPFHPGARPAAKAALAAGEQGKYFEMADTLLDNQQMLTDDGIKELAKKIGLNMGKFEKDLKDKDAQYEGIIAADMKLVDDVDVRGTPTYFINGKKTMARDLAGYKKEIDQILAAKAGK